jgi:hypothetical protein
MPSQILVIDNDFQVRELLVAALHPDGHHAAGVRSYPEAIAHLQQCRVDLAITDGYTARGWPVFPPSAGCSPSSDFSSYRGVCPTPWPCPKGPRGLTLLPKPCPLATMLAVVRHTLDPSPLEFVRAILERGRFDVLTRLALSPPAPPSPTSSSCSSPYCDPGARTEVSRAYATPR